MKRSALMVMAALCVAAAPGWARAQGEGPEGGRAPPLPYLLQLRPDQRAAWRAYQDEMALERVDQVEAAQEATQTNAMSTPQRLQQQLAALPHREAQLRRQAQAVDAFYAQLSPEQRRMFDRVTRTPLPPSPMVARRRPPPPQPSMLAQPAPGDPLPPPGG